jgi:hypothetical protein
MLKSEPEGRSVLKATEGSVLSKLALPACYTAINALSRPA